jgi:hypothetical protein
LNDGIRVYIHLFFSQCICLVVLFTYFILKVSFLCGLAGRISRDFVSYLLAGEGVGAYLAASVISFKAISGATNITFADLSMHIYPYLPRDYKKNP